MAYQSQKRYILISILIFFLFLIFAYSNTFNGEFQFDDDAIVIRNPYVKDISKFFEVNPLINISSGGRPVTTFTFSLNYYFGGFDVRWYHITNLLIHISNGILIFYLVLLAMKSPKLTAKTVILSISERSHHASLVSLIATALFLLHPIQTEAVSYISQRSELLVSFFYLSSLIAYVKARLQTPDPSLQTIRLKSVSWYLTSVICYFLALGSKEIAVTIPVIALLYDFYFLEDRQFLKRIAGPGIFTVLSFIGGILILKGLGRGIAAGFSLKEFTPSEYLMTQFRVVTTYIRLLFLPINQNVDYDLRVSRTLFEIDTALSFIFILVLIITSIMSFKKWRIGSFFILWFFIILAPTSSIIPILDLIFEHRVYLASAGIFVIVSSTLSRWILMPQKYNKIAVCTVIILMIVLAVATFQRNKVWQTRLALWEDAARKSPIKARPHNNLGNAYMALGRYINASEEYKKAIAIKKDDFGILFNLAVSLDKAGLVDQALYHYELFYYLAPDSLKEQKEGVSERIKVIKKMSPMRN